MKESPPKKVFLLWDIDGTLLDTRGAGVKPLSNAIEFVINRKVGFDRHLLAGKTDYEIIDYLTKDLISLSLSNKMVDEILALYIQGLESNLLKAPVRVLGTVKFVLSEMAQEPHIRMGILSGNCMHGGRIKLKSGQILDYFDPQYSFFASKDNKSRVSLVESAVAKCETVIIVGDSPNDIQAAKYHNQPIISIASGLFTFEELDQLNPGNVLQANFELNQFTALMQKFI
jgi:phosphoglycolate phosphatase-like HAD superfamily hydrolase